MSDVFLDDHEPAAFEVGYGRLGLRGDLGYERQQVIVHGQHIAHAISAHAPSTVELELDGTFRTFHARAAFNQDARDTLADFVVVADGRAVAVVPALTPSDGPRDVVAAIDGARRLSLHVETRRFEQCHSVWLEPRVSREAAAIRIETDALRRVRILPPRAHPHAERCIATVVSAGYGSLLDDLLASLRRNGNCDDALMAVFVVDGGDGHCAEVIARHGALRVDCQSIAPLNEQVKSVLYTAAHVIDAERFLCIDADTLVTGDLNALFSAIDAAPPRSILICRDAFIPQRLDQALTGFYKGTARDFQRLLGHTWGEERFDLVVNDGVFAVHRDGLLALDAFLRGLTAAVPWMDEPGKNLVRNQFLFNLALARMRCAVEIDAAFNLQVHMHDVQIEHAGSSARATWSGRPVHIIHFCGWGRSKHAVIREHFA